jgi:hypothetical protein
VIFWFQGFTLTRVLIAVQQLQGKSATAKSAEEIIYNLSIKPNTRVHIYNEKIK